MKTRRPDAPLRTGLGRMTALLATAALALTLLVTAPLAQAASPSLAITPAGNQFTGGSQLVLTGNIGVSGRRALAVQRTAGRIGDAWKNDNTPTTFTEADGSFEIKTTAPAMWAINIRVVSGKHRTPSVMTYSRAQEVILTQTSSGLVGQPLTFHADTVGRAYSGYRDLTAPLLVGRTLTLQRQVTATRWEDVASTVSDAHGLATFATTHRSTGDVYRVRMADWRLNGDVIGWTVSYPHRVTARAGQIKSGTIPLTRTSLRSSGSTSGSAASTPGMTTVRTHAHTRYGWGRSPRYRFEWEAGDSLSSAPYEGSQTSARWAEGGDGTGRVTMRNGGMLFSSDAYNSAPDGAYGDTWATVVGAEARFGRWEIRGLTTQLGGAGAKYRVRYELVPVKQSTQRCGTASIVLAESSGPGSPVKFGVRGSNGTTWGRTIKQRSIGAANSVAVQVVRKHITWFVNGKPTGTVRAKAAIPKGPMTVRISFVGEGRSQMASAKHTTDWVRSYTLKHGKKPSSKITLRKGAAHGGC